MVVINWIALFLSAAIATLISYFGFVKSTLASSWRLELNAKPLPKEDSYKILGIIFLCYCVVSFLISIVMGRGDYSGMADGLKYGFLVGLGFVGMSSAILHIVSGRSRKSWLAETGILLLSFSSIGAVIGSMQ